MREGGGVVGKSILAVPTLPRLAAGAHGPTDWRTRAPPALLGGASTGRRPSAPALPTPSRPAPSRRGRWLLPRPAARGAQGSAPRPGLTAPGLPGPPGARRSPRRPAGRLWERVGDTPPPPPPPPSVETRCCPGSGACCKVGTPAPRRAEGTLGRRAGPPPAGLEGGAAAGGGGAQPGRKAQPRAPPPPQAAGRRRAPTRSRRGCAGSS